MSAFIIRVIVNSSGEAMPTASHFGGTACAALHASDSQRPNTCDQPCIFNLYPYIWFGSILITCSFST
ncbi:hypothetical protein N431DRAFT_24927 [Stipitochalara longipes BDJ]|nr:hypothetical protein N431DRAFT_24927 [Stipitochalara longipes BDJ]